MERPLPKPSDEGYIETRLLEALAEAHLELAVRLLAEGKALADRDPVQDSAKLYKAAEEAVNALAIRLDLSEVLRRVEERG